MRKWVTDREQMIVAEIQEYKLWCQRQDRNRNGVGVIMN